MVVISLKKAQIRAALCAVRQMTHPSKIVLFETLR